MHAIRLGFLPTSDERGVTTTRRGCCSLHRLTTSGARCRRAGKRWQPGPCRSTGLAAADRHRCADRLTSGPTRRAQRSGGRRCCCNTSSTPRARHRGGVEAAAVDRRWLRSADRVDAGCNPWKKRRWGGNGQRASANGTSTVERSTRELDDARKEFFCAPRRPRKRQGAGWERRRPRGEEPPWDGACCRRKWALGGEAAGGWRHGRCFGALGKKGPLLDGCRAPWREGN